MSAGYYPRLAVDGIRKNKRMYVPFLLTCIVMVMMHYIIVFLQYDDATSLLRGADLLRSILGFGGWVITVFTCIFLFYSNSFLIRRRKKEFGLYNILGMGKRNISKILFWETFIIACVSLGLGIGVGIVFSKFAELGLLRIMQWEVGYSFSVSGPALRTTASVFGVIFLLLFLNSLCRVKFSSAISLLRSENAGDKPPKANWLIGILGVAILVAAYYIAITIEDPVLALALFFVAVLMVIVGTYLVMISGSVAFCRLLQKRKKYYYTTNHFVSVSSMVYRMKRNGAGLASICILVTMVLVMLSTTTCMYFGGEESLYSRYPREINVSFTMNDAKDMDEGKMADLWKRIVEAAQTYGISPENVYYYQNAFISGLLEDSVVETDVTKISLYDMDAYTNVFQFSFVPLADYNALMGTEETLENDEAMIFTYRKGYNGETISFRQGSSFHIKKKVEDFVDSGESAMMIMPTMTIIVPDLVESVRGLDRLADYNGDRMVTFRWLFHFDTGVERERQIELFRELQVMFSDPVFRETYGISYGVYESRELNKDGNFSLYGGFLYLGIMLSIVFVLAAVLIIYYKQLSEGYEDQARFEIMQKVGMTEREIRKSINSQLLTVFFFPLVFAGCHLVFAFPMIRKLLLLFGLNNVMLFAGTTGISALVFAVFYTVVYRVTSNSYYHIVSGGTEKEQLP